MQDKRSTYVAILVVYAAFNFKLFGLISKMHVLENVTKFEFFTLYFDINLFHHCNYYRVFLFTLY